jgi:hypothetical protein
MTTSIDTFAQARPETGALIASFLARATAGLREIRARRDAARDVHSLRVLSDRQLHDLGWQGTPLELMVRGLGRTTAGAAHVEA